MNKTLYIVVPCYNETEVIEEASRRLLDKVSGLISKKKIAKNSRIIFVDDGSKDDTWQKILELNKENSTFGGVKLSRNRGHQNALLAGLMSVREKADFVISMDADLQDDIDAVDRMIDEFYAGSDIVYGVRSSRKKDTFFKKYTALFFYKIMTKMGVDSVYNHADYRLMSARALRELSNFKEINLFLRGIVPLIGFKSSIVEYDRAERFAGESKYPLKKMLNFAIDGITSFSVKPIRLVSGAGFAISSVSILVLAYSLVQHILGNTVDGWTFVVFSIWILGGFQMIALGIIGEYIGKIYSEVKGRPRFIIEKEI